MSRNFIPCRHSQRRTDSGKLLPERATGLRISNLAGADSLRRGVELVELGPAQREPHAHQGVIVAEIIGYFRVSQQRNFSSSGEKRDFSMPFGISDRTKSCGDLSRDIDVTDGQVDEIDERLDIPESTGAILDDADDTVEAFCGRVG